MEIKLGKEDIKTLINENYSGIKDITIDEKVEVILIVEDMNAFGKRKPNSLQTHNTIPVQTRTLTPEEKTKQELKAGGMISGGVKRSLIRM